ncbi:MAG: response regulator [Candidatus Eremiobacteraeota bacterium]|nr:response regulator [Candidatus Eremiobacteraeota bacterium]
MRAVFVRIASMLGHLVVGEAAEAEAALRLVVATLPDAVVIDGRLPPEGAIAVVRHVRTIVPAAEVFVIAALGETARVRDAVAAGARGIIARPLLAHRVAASLAQGPPLL